MTAALVQAAAEYVGVAMKTALNNLGNLTGEVGRWFGNRPWAAILAVVGLLVLMRLTSLRRR